jgi:hypothetical protein
MQISDQIDHLVTKLNELKPLLSEDFESNGKKFEDLLTSSLETDYTFTEKAAETKDIYALKTENKLPSWLDTDYGYDPAEPRKPNMRELMEAISGKKVEDLYREPDENWQKVSSQASEILYGVVGSNLDTRNWQSIMVSKNILTAAQEETRLMLEPKVDIESRFNEQGVMIEQIALLKDKQGNNLRALSGNIASVEETLHNFGATKDSIPNNLESLIKPGKFDPTLLSFLKGYRENVSSSREVEMQTATEAISSRLKEEIPVSELSKL